MEESASHYLIWLAGITTASTGSSQTANAGNGKWLRIQEAVNI
jgi:hypothetical protein